MPLDNGAAWKSTCGMGVSNSIVWNNDGTSLQANAPSIAVEHTLIEGGWMGSGNIDLDPLFVDPMNDDYRLLPGSPCIDAGNNTVLPYYLRMDLLGLRRLVDDPATPDTGIADYWHARKVPSGDRILRPVVDIGAYEFQ